MAVLNKGVINNTKKEQGYGLTTSYAVPGNLTSRGFSSSMDGYGSEGLTGSKLRGYSPTLTTPTVSSSTGSTRRTGTRKASAAKATSVPMAATASASAEATPATAYGGDYDILTGEYIGPGSSTSEPSYDAASAYKKLIEAYRGRESDYQNYLDRMNEVAQNTYDRSMRSLDDSYNRQLELLGGSYNTQKSTLEQNLERARNNLLSSYNNSRANQERNAESSLRQAYINNMLQRRNIAQQLSSMGLTGGMTETTLAGMANNYGNQRNDINKALASNLANIETGYNNNVSELEGNYSSSLADALAAYNSQLANANSQRLAQLINLENALADSRRDAYSNYMNMRNNYNQDYYNILRSAIADKVDLASIM